MQPFLAQVRIGYDRWASTYDHDANPLQALEGPKVREAAGNPHAQHVLDLGCGTGRHAHWLAAEGASVTALDFSDGMLDQARKKPGADRIRFIVHDLHTPLRFAPEFDLVVCGLVLEHLAELHRFFSETHRVLLPGGRAVISAMHPAMFLQGTQARFKDPATGEIIMPGSVPHSISDFVMAALSAGFSITSISEHAPDAHFATRFPRAAKYVGWPMLVVMVLAT